MRSVTQRGPRMSGVWFGGIVDMKIVSIDSKRPRAQRELDLAQAPEGKRKPARKSHATDPFTPQRIVKQFILGSGVCQIANREWKTPGYVEQVLRGALVAAPLKSRVKKLHCNKCGRCRAGQWSEDGSAFVCANGHQTAYGPNGAAANAAGKGRKRSRRWRRAV